MQVCRSLVGGEELAGDAPAIDKIYPATGEVIARIEPADDAVLDRAVEIAAAAQKEWALRSGHDRAQVLARAARLLREHNDELARIEVLDVGKVYGEAVSADVPSGADAMDFFAALAQTDTGDMRRYPDAIAYCERVPLGICAGIGAWNYPVQIACWKAAPALAAGNAFILKPSEMTPLTAHRVAELLSEAGLPEGCSRSFMATTRSVVPSARIPGLRRFRSPAGSIPDA